MSIPIDVHKIFAAYYRETEALAYAVSKKLEEGSICLDAEKYMEEMEKITDSAVAKAANPFWEDTGHFRKQMQEGDFVTHNPRVLKPFIVEKRLVYLQRYHHYETSIEENIKRLGKNFFIITGGPGTGKTTSVGKKLQKIFEDNPDVKVAMAAPTGKAAARMEESIRDFVRDNKNVIPKDIQEKLKALHAQTIHRLLGYIPNSVFFRHNKDNPLPFDMLLVDEASMIDVAMMAKLMDATENRTELFLIGDKDQLASVEAGSVFGDMCRAVLEENKHVKGTEIVERIDGINELVAVEKTGNTGVTVEVRLKNFRAKKSPLLIEFGKKIIAGEKDFGESISDKKQVVINTGYSETLFKEYAALYLEYIKEPDVKKALEKLDEIRFLCVTREHKYSVAHTNKRIREFLEKEIDNPVLFKPKSGFYHNQPIIITQNDYELGINNGDVGIIRKDDKDGSIYANFPSAEGKVHKVNATYLNQYDTVFAMTIHKSQGSGFKNVVVLLPEKRAQKLLTRELLYTAVTRAKKKVLIQATPEVLEKCIDATVSRASGLTQRLNPESK